MSGRAAIVALVLCALALAYAYPVRTYLEQRAEIDDMAEAQAEQRDRIADLAAERDKWDDPEYVQAQIRSRLLLVDPGEELLIVIDDAEGAARDAGVEPPPEPEGPWYDELMDSINEADQIGQE